MGILLLETLHPDAHAALAAVDEVWLAPTPTTFAPETRWDDVRAIVTRGRGRIDAALLQRAPGLRAVARAGVGLDNVDLAAAARAGVPVLYAPGANAATVAEHTLTLILALVRGVFPMARAVAEGAWARRDGYAGDEVAGKVLGVVGFGAIGRRVAALGAAVGMEVIVAARPGRALDTPLPTLPLADLLGRADVLTLHLPLTADTRGLVDAAALARMKPGAFLVNTARGALVDEAAVAAALAQGRLAGFAADVLAEEPPPAGAPLPGLPGTLLTPHVASLTARTYREMCVRTAEAVAAVLRGAAPDPRNVYRPRAQEPA
jgi:phosphoglycerate dehydrogenase-like enzyme